MFVREVGNSLTRRPSRWRESFQPSGKVIWFPTEVTVRLSWASDEGKVLLYVD